MNDIIASKYAEVAEHAAQLKAAEKDAAQWKRVADNLEHYASELGIERLKTHQLPFHIRSPVYETFGEARSICGYGRSAQPRSLS